MKKLLKGALSLAIIATVGTQSNAATNDYSIEVKSPNFSKHSRATNPLYGITYTEENPNYMADPNWPLAEMSFAYTQSNYSYTLPTHQMVRQFGVSMGVVYWINPAEDYIYWWNTVTGESGKNTPTKSYGVGYADGIDNPNFDFEFLGAETGSGAIAQDWYGNLVHMWNDGMNGWGTTAGTHFVQGYAVYKSAGKYGKLMDFTPKLSTMNDTGRESYPYYYRTLNDDGTIKVTDATMTSTQKQQDLRNYTYAGPESMRPNPNYPAKELNWSTNYDYHKASTSYTKLPTDFLGVSGNLWGKGAIQGGTLGASTYYNGYSTGQVFHACNDIAFGNMFADGQYSNWYLNYRLTVGNRTAPGYYPWSGLWQNTDVANHWVPRDYAFENAATEYFFMESDVLEYFWSIPYAGLAEYDISDRSTYKWHGYVDDLNYSSYIGTTSENRHKSDMFASPEVDSIKGTRVIVHNYWLNWMPTDISDTDNNANKRNGSIIIQYSKYDGGMSTTSAPVFTGEPTRTYAPIGYAYGWAETDATTKQTIPTPNFPVKFQNSTVNSWNELERVYNNVFGLYTHVPGRGFTKFFITAVKPNNAVSGLSVSQKLDSNNNIVNTLTWTPQKYDRETMHTYEVWYRKKKSGATNYEDKKEIEGQNLEVWMPAGKASVNYTSLNASGDTIYTSTYNGCKFEHIAPYGTDANGNYDRVYEYMIIPVYDASSHRGTESAVVTMTSKAPVCPVEGTLKQVTGENINGETLYGFSVQLDSKVDINATGANTAAKMIVVPQDDVTKAALANNTGVTGPDGVTLTESDVTTATQYTIYNTNDLSVTGYHLIVEGFTVGSGGELPSITWHNIDPEKEYKVKVYVVATSSSYFTPTTELATTLIVPEPKWSLTTADFHKLAGDYSGTMSNEDQPIGAYRRINPETGNLERSHPVTYNNANYYGTNGSMIKPIFVTDEVLGKYDTDSKTFSNAGWEVDYTINIYDTDENGEKALIDYGHFYPQTNNAYAVCYSNVSDVTCDVIGLVADYTLETGEDGRYRKIYNPTAKTYAAEITVTYKRGDITVTRTTTSDLMTGTTTLPELGVSNTPGSSVLGALYKRPGTHFFYNSDNGDNGYYNNYYDAAVLFNWNEYDALYRYMGYYAKSQVKCYGHYESDENGNRLDNVWVEYLAGSVLTDAEVAGYNEANQALTGGAIGYGATVDDMVQTNWSALAIANNKMPMQIHYVHGSDTPLSGADNVANVKFDVTLTAEYPLVVATTGEEGGNFCDIIAAEDPSTYAITDAIYMDVLTVPTQLSDMYVDNTTVTTGVEGILTEACGGVKLYPNPVGSTLTLEAPMALGEVRIFTMDGQLVKVVRDINTGTAKIDVAGLPQGMYIVNTLGVAKIMVKY